MRREPEIPVAVPEGLLTLYRLSLGLHGPALDPDAITEALGLSPWKARPPVPSRSTLDPLRTGAWVFSAGEGSDLAALGAALVEAFEPVLPAAEGLDGRWKLTVYVGAEGDWVSPWLPPALVGLAGALGAGIALDVFLELDEAPVTPSP